MRTRKKKPGKISLKRVGSYMGKSLYQRLGRKRRKSSVKGRKRAASSSYW